MILSIFVEWVTKKDSGSRRAIGELKSIEPMATVIKIDDRHRLQFLHYSDHERTVDEKLSKPAPLASDWSDEKWRSFATEFAALVRSYQDETQPGRDFFKKVMPLFCVAALIAFFPFAIASII